MIERVNAWRRNNCYEGIAVSSLGTRFASRIVSEGNYFAVTAPPRQLAGYAPDPAPGTSRIRPVNIASESVPGVVGKYAGAGKSIR